MKISKSPLQRNALRALVLANVLTVAAFAQTATPSNSSPDRNVNDRPADDRTTNGSVAAANQTTPARASDNGSTMTNGAMRSDTMNDSSMSKLSWGDKRFLNKAAKDGMEEVAISQVAAERATNPDVKALAQKIVSDHQKADGQIMSLASNRGVSLSDNMDQSDMNKLAAKWQKKDAGNEFDRDYVKKMVSDHEDAIELFGKAAKSDDPQVASLASQTLPTLQEHYSRAQELEKSLKD